MVFNQRLFDLAVLVESSVWSGVCETVLISAHVLGGETWLRRWWGCTITGGSVRAACFSNQTPNPLPPPAPPAEAGAPLHPFDDTGGGWGREPAGDPHQGRRGLHRGQPGDRPALRWRWDLPRPCCFHRPLYLLRCCFSGFACNQFSLLAGLLGQRGHSDLCPGNFGASTIVVNSYEKMKRNNLMLTHLTFINKNLISTHVFF